MEDRMKWTRWLVIAALLSWAGCGFVSSSGVEAGTVGNEPVYHASLSPAGYAQCLEENGMRLTGFMARDPETQDHSVLMARKDG